MKKVFAAGAALLMAGSIATAADMEDKAGVTIKGNARARVIYKDKYDFGNTDKDASVTMDSRVRLDVTGTAAGGAYVKARIRLIEQKFNGAADASLTNNIYADKAYIGVPFNDSFTLEGGKYRVSYGNGFMYDDIGLAGFRGVVKGEGWRLVPFVEVQSEGQDSSVAQDVQEDNDSYRLGAAVNLTMVENWNFGAIAAFDTDDRVETVDGEATGNGNADGFFGSIFAKGTMGAFGLEGEIAYAENGVSLDAVQGAGTDDGFGGYVRGSWMMDALTVSLDLGFTKDGFKADPFYGFIMVGGEHPITVDNFGDAGDWTWGGLTAKYAVTEALSLAANVVYMNIDGNDDLVSADDKRLAKMLEVSGVLKYAVSKGCTFSWYAGYLQPDFDGRLDGVGVEDDGAFGTYAKFDVSF